MSSNLGAPQFVHSSAAARAERYEIYDVKEDSIKIQSFKFAPIKQGSMLTERADGRIVTPYWLSPIKNQIEPTTCNIALTNNKLRLSSGAYQILNINGNEYIIFDNTFVVELIYAMQVFFNEITFDFSDSFGCSLANFGRDYKLPVYGYIYFAYKLLISIYALAVLSAPIVATINKYKEQK